MKMKQQQQPTQKPPHLLLLALSSLPFRQAQPQLPAAPLPIPVPVPDVDPVVPVRLFGCIYNCQTGALGPEPPSCSPSDPTPPAKNVSSDLRLLLLLLPSFPVPSVSKADGGPDEPFFPGRIRHTPFPAPAAATAELLSVSTSELPAAASVEAVAFAFDLGFHVPAE